jgi:hypothetical protein
MGPAALIPIGLSIWNGIQGQRSQNKANNLQQQAMDMAMQQYAERAPFRSQAMAMMPNIEGDTGLPQNFGVNAGNPYARKTRVSTAMALPQQAAPSSQAMDQLAGLQQMRNSLANAPGFRGNLSKLDAEIARLSNGGGLIPLGGR